MSPATPSAQTAASPAADTGLSPHAEAFKFALSLSGGIVGTLALVYYGSSTDFKPPFALLCAAAALAYGAAIWRRFGPLAAWSAVLLLHAGVLYAGALRGEALLAQLAFGLGAPAAAYWLCRLLRWRSSVFALAILACLTADLWNFARSDSALYEGQPSPASRGVDVSLSTPRWPTSRSTSPPEWISEDAQAVRNPELVLRRAFAFAVPMTRGYYTVQALGQDEKDGKIPPPAPRSFAESFNGRRWATFILGKDYFRLIHSGLAPDVIRTLLAVDEPLFQFKSGAVVVPDARLTQFFGGLPPGAARELLRCYAVLAEDGGVWDRLRASPEEALTRSRACAPPSFRFTISRQSDDIVEGGYDAGRDGALYWSDGYDERWRAFVDGRQVPIARAGVAFKALPLPGGTHRLRLAYEPHAFQIGLLLHFAAIAACLIAALATGWWSRASRSR